MCTRACSCVRACTTLYACVLVHTGAYGFVMRTSPLLRERTIVYAGVLVKTRYERVRNRVYACALLCTRANPCVRVVTPVYACIHVSTHVFVFALRPGIYVCSRLCKRT